MQGSESAVAQKHLVVIFIVAVAQEHAGSKIGEGWDATQHHHHWLRLGMERFLHVCFYSLLVSSRLKHWELRYLQEQTMSLLEYISNLQPRRLGVIAGDG